MPRRSHCLVGLSASRKRSAARSGLLAAVQPRRRAGPHRSASETDARSKMVRRQSDLATTCCREFLQAHPLTCALRGGIDAGGHPGAPGRYPMHQRCRRPGSPDPVRSSRRLRRVQWEHGRDDGCGSRRLLRVRELAKRHCRRTKKGSGTPALTGSNTSVMLQGHSDLHDHRSAVAHRRVRAASHLGRPAV